MDQSESYPVKLYIYDLSRGMARQLSPVMLGKLLMNHLLVCFIIRHLLDGVGSTRAWIRTLIESFFYSTQENNLMAFGKYQSFLRKAVAVPLQNKWPAIKNRKKTNKTHLVWFIGVLVSYRHTGVVVHGKEFFFGGEGINNCPPVRNVFFFFF